MVVTDASTKQIRALLPDEISEHASAEEMLGQLTRAYEEALKQQATLESELREQRSQLQTQLDELEDAKGDIEKSLYMIAAILDLAHDGIMFVNNDGVPDIFNQAAMDILGLEHNQLVNFNYTKFAHYIRRHAVGARAILESLKLDLQDPLKPARALVELNSGAFIEVYSNPQLIDDEVVGRVWSLRNVTDLKSSEREAQFNACHDRLTGLPNRTLLYDRLQQAVSDMHRTQGKLALLFMDLDGFKDVNDTLGHDAGDELLKLVAARLSHELREADTIARLGGDEFVVVLRNIADRQSVEMVLERIMQCFDEAYGVLGKEIYIGTSVGVSIYPEDANDVDGLVKRADMAMYYAKSLGRNNYQFYHARLADLSSFRLSLRNDLHGALKRGEFFLRYQPKVDLCTRDIVGVEALLRWQREGEVVTQPLEFIPEAEKNGMIIPISEWVVEEACRTLRDVIEQRGQPMGMGLNISAQHFRTGDIYDCLKKALDKYQLPGELLLLEITEHTFISDMKSAVNKLQRLKQLGVRIAIDDFGKGYSSFNYLKELPLDVIKLDQSFVENVVTSERDAVLVESMLKIAEAYQITVVAEGVESQEVASKLTQLGCHQAQGYWYREPLNESALLELLCS